MRIKQALLGIMMGGVVLGFPLFQKGIAYEGGELKAVYFSPDDAVMTSLIDLMEQEKKSIRIAAYCLMHPGVAKALKKAKERGVFVEVVVDPYSVKSRSPLASMVKKGVPVYVWKSLEEGKKRGLMHHKFCLLGEETVWTGSCNFTRQGEIANRENVVVLAGEEIATAFLEQFETIKKEECISYADFVSDSVQERSKKDRKTAQKLSTK